MYSSVTKSFSLFFLYHTRDALNTQALNPVNVSGNELAAQYSMKRCHVYTPSKCLGVTFPACTSFHQSLLWHKSGFLFDFGEGGGGGEKVGCFCFCFNRFKTWFQKQHKGRENILRRLLKA